MTCIVLVETNGTVKSLKAKDVSRETLYKKCGFRKAEGFSKITSWDKSDNIVELWGRLDGKNNVKNSYQFPKNVTKQVFGNCCVISKSKNELTDMDENLWNKICNNFTEDENDKDENNKEDILDYSSDDSSSSEDSFMDSELKEESYIYSDEEEKI